MISIPDPRGPRVATALRISSSVIPPGTTEADDDEVGEVEFEVEVGGSWIPLRREIRRMRSGRGRRPPLRGKVEMEISMIWMESS